MDIFNCLKEECTQVGSTAKNKSELLAEIAKLAKKSPILNSVPEDTLLNALIEREKTGSTGFENGIAIPHCRLGNIEEFVIGMITIPKGINFEAYDGKPSKIIFFIIAPEANRDFHIRMLSTISRTLATESVRNEVLSKITPVDLKETFLRYVRDDVRPDEDKPKCLFHIALQHEDKLNDILQALSALSASVSVIEAKDTSEYLHRLPLFSSFWSNDDKGFHILIVGTINKKLANELFRNIDSIVGGLRGNTGAMITIQDVMLSAGALT